MEYKKTKTKQEETLNVKQETCVFSDDNRKIVQQRADTFTEASAAIAGLYGAPARK